MAHGFAAQSGGALRIESTLGQGTVVTLWLPEAATMPVAAAAGG
jgi:signal transduction histidine kinase